LSKKALITGITGQDGSYLAEFLLEKGYEVHGTLRRNSRENYEDNISHIKTKIVLHHADLADSSNIFPLIENIMPDEIYNLAAQSHVKVSFELPEYTTNVNAIGALRILETIRNIQEKNPKKRIKFYQASTSEMFGEVMEIPQTEKTPFWPRSPYAIAKVFAHQSTINYREAYGIFACSGILFNHESPRRGNSFVTQKIVKGIQDIIDGKKECLELGNLSALRDWGHAKDYVEAMWLMMQQNESDCYVISTGKQYSVKYFVEKVCAFHGIEIEWVGKNEKETGWWKNRKDKKKIITVNKNFFRPAEVYTLLGDNSRARKKLNWEPKYSLDELILEMCEAEKKQKKF
jgi:GDPmannose 4,6-dehydratase